MYSTKCITRALHDINTNINYFVYPESYSML